ncbi:MAG: sensor histidine kinase [Bacteroidota bacterium]
MKSPILKKLILLILTISLGSILTSGFIINISLNHQFQNYLNKTEELRQQQIVNNLAELYREYGDWSHFPRNINIGRAAFMGNLRYVTDQQGEIVILARPRMPRHNNISLTARPIHLDGVLIGTAYFGRNILQNILTAQDEMFRYTINRSILLTMFLTGLISFMVAVVIARRFTAPIMEMNEAAKNMTSGNLESRVSNLPNDELGQLGMGLNQLAERLSAVEKLRKKMTADVAHDLRTPLATVRSHLEGMIDQIIPANKENLESLLEEVNRLTLLIDGLQEIALSDKAIHNFQIEPIELSSYLKEIVRRLEPLFHSKGVSLHFAPRDTCFVKLDREALAKILDNLLSNALKFTPPGKNVRLNLKTEGETVIIEVSDQGVGIAAKDLPYIFERFYRTDRSRNRDSGGFGLGLTIVKELTEALGGMISVESKLGEGSIFSVKFPVAPRF